MKRGCNHIGAETIRSVPKSGPKFPKCAAGEEIDAAINRASGAGASGVVLLHSHNA